jgi:putative two-component system response regulator
MARPKVLLVDDEDLLREAVATVVRQQYDVVMARDGHEALAAVARDRPDLVVLDVMMAHLSEGFDVAKALKGDPATAAIPIVLLTGVDQVYDIRPEVGTGWVKCDRYLTKPPEPKVLMAAIEELLATSAAPR